MKIILDAMGGDLAPQAQVEGAVRAVRAYDVEVVLVGREAEILDVLRDLGHASLPMGLSIVNASEVVTMDDDPTNVFREKKDSSLSVGLKLLKDGGGDGFVSAGNTGALLVGATLIPRRIRGIRRAALTPVIPNREGGALLIDCGANTECVPEYLVQFAYMGSYYVRRVLGRETPRVGLLSNGTEETKGTPLHKETYQLLQEAHALGKLNFIGNIEGRDVLLGGVDVVVTDGFTGNVLLKGIEGTAMFLTGELKSIFMQSATTKLAALLVRKGLRNFKKKMDVSEVGGTALLGITKPVIKAHGNSDAKTISSAIRQARDLAQSGIIEDITTNIGKTSPKHEENA